MLVLDLWSELQPAWKQTNGFYGKPFIWNMLHNFGGRTGLYGALPKVATGPYEAFSDSSVNMVGIGLVRTPYVPFLLCVVD
jgi:alpha-N-acetylglucosaminidase